MHHQKIYCEYTKLNPRIIATILRNTSINKWGYIYADYDTIIFLDKSHSRLLHYNIFNKMNEYEMFPIIYSEEWICIQRFLNSLDNQTNTNILKSLNMYPTKILLMIDVILSFPVNFDIKYIILTKLFTRFKQPMRLFTVVDDKWIPFCVCIDGTCNYLIKFKTHERNMKTLINDFITSKMNYDVNMMYISDSTVTFILYNDYCSIKFTILVFDYINDHLSMYPLDISSSRQYPCSSIGEIIPFELNKIDDFYVNYNSIIHVNTNKHISNSLRKIREILSSSDAMRCWIPSDNKLFY